MWSESHVITPSHNKSNEIRQCSRMSACGEITLATRLKTYAPKNGRCAERGAWFHRQRTGDSQLLRIAT